MNKVNRKIVTALIVSTAIVIIAGGTVTYGFQGVLAAFGLLFILASFGIGVYIVRKARLYAKVVKQANWINNIEITPVSTDDKKWMMKHLDELFKEEKKRTVSALAPITKKDRKQIMNQLDEFLAETSIRHNTITPEDQKFIMENVDLLFDNNRKEDRQTFTW